MSSILNALNSAQRQRQQEQEQKNAPSTADQIHYETESKRLFRWLPWLLAVALLLWWSWHWFSSPDLEATKQADQVRTVPQSSPQSSPPPKLVAFDRSQEYRIEGLYLTDDVKQYRVIINGKVLGLGESIKPGVLVQDIREDGVILQVGGKPLRLKISK